MKKRPLSQIVAKLESGARPKNEVVEQNGVPSLGGEHINKDGGFNFEKTRYISHDYFKSCTKGKIKTNDILIVKDGATTGKVSFVSDLFPFKDATINEHVFKLVVDNSKALPKYVFHYLYSEFGQSDILKDFRGATIGGISKGFTEKVLIPLPDLAEQRRIAHLLDKADALRKKNKQLLAAYDELLKATFLEMFGDPVKNEMGWEEKELINISKNHDDIKCGPFGTQLQKSEYQKQGIPLWGIPHVNCGFIKDTEEFVTPEKANDLISYSIKPHDIVMSRKGRVGACSVYPIHMPLGIMHSDVIRLRCDNSIAEPFFIAHQFKLSRKFNNQVEQVSSGAIMAGINVSKLKKVKILIPPISLQTRFAQIVENIETQKNMVKKAMQENDDLFNGLVQEVFS